MKKISILSGLLLLGLFGSSCVVAMAEQRDGVAQQEWQGGWQYYIERWGDEGFIDADEEARRTTASEIKKCCGAMLVSNLVLIKEALLLIRDMPIFI